jgi:hypothetical protein
VATGLCGAAGTFRVVELSGIDTELEFVAFEGRVTGLGVTAATEEFEVVIIVALVALEVCPGRGAEPRVNVMREELDGVTPAAVVEDLTVLSRLGLGSVTRVGGAAEVLDGFAVLIKLGLGSVTSVGIAGIEVGEFAGATRLVVLEAGELAALVEFVASPGKS